MSDEMKDLTAEELAQLIALEARANPAPWGEEWCYGACRHINKNCDVDAFAGGEAAGQDGWGRYDGIFVARMRNALPRLIAELVARRAAGNKEGA